MSAQIPGTGFLENLFGFLHAAGALATPFLRGRRDRWGASPSELARSYPGDELIGSPRGGSLRAVTLDAPVNAVWPWIQQIGQKRGGFYSYQRLENLAGCQIRNVDRLLPNVPALRVGDHVYLSAGMAPYDVVIFDPPHALVLYQLVDPRNQRRLAAHEPRPAAWFSGIWGFHLSEAEGARARLVGRALFGHSGGLGNRLTMALVGPISHVMERAMFRNLGRLAANSSAPPRQSVEQAG